MTLLLVSGWFTQLGCGARTGLLAVDDEIAEGGPGEGAPSDTRAPVGIEAGPRLRPGDAAGPLGDRDRIDAVAPTNVVALAVGALHTCALSITGAVRCWGYGGDGTLGHADAKSIGDNEPPISAGDVRIGGRVSQLTAGRDYTCALIEGGTVRCWGRNDYGQLGYGGTKAIGKRETPASAGDVDIGGRVVELAAGFGHTCALLDGGRVRCWGDGSYGQLGYGNTQSIGDDETPASAGDVNTGGRVVQLASGVSHTCALLDGGRVRCWGDGSYGQLGYGNMQSIGDDETPASAGDVNVGGQVTAIVAGTFCTCALLTTGTVRCWGHGSSGQLGYGNTSHIGDDETPASAGDVSLGGFATRLAAGWFHVCALLDGGRVRCWGDGSSGQLGYGNANDLGDDETPASAGDLDLGGTVSALALGPSASHACVVLTSTSVRCWGSSSSGQLGYGNVDDVGDDETPASAGDVAIF